VPFKFKDSTISARPLSIADDDAATEIGMLARPTPDSPLQIRHVTFGEFQVAAEIDGDWPIPRVTEKDDLAAVKAAYDAWRALPRSFPRQWIDELNRVENAAKNG
jgi:hypothetical protein